MRSELLLKHFDRLSEAPGAVSRFRQFVLDLAVRGKLVEQSLQDEPVFEFLKRIDEGNERSVQNGARKSPHNVPHANGAPPFATPSNWVWVSLGRIVVSRDSERIPVSKEDRNTRAKTFDYYGASGVIDKIDTFLFDKPLLLIGEDGANLINRSTPIAFIARGQYWVNNHAHVLDGISEEFLRFLELQINAIDLKPYVTGTAQPKMNQAKMNSIPIVLPPEPEQKRIVAKVDELMALCDRLEAARHEREQRRDRLTKASLRSLSNSANAEGSRVCVNFCLGQLFRLTKKSEQINELRQTILNLAVRGRLVPQDPSDEPASEPLYRIQAEKARLLQDGDLKKDKTAWDGLPSDPLHDIPSNWIWTRLQDVFEISRGGSPRPAGDPRYFGGSIPWVTVGEVTKDSGKYLTDTENGLTEEGAARSRFISSGDLLLTNSGATLGVPKISRIRACINDGVAVLRLFHSFELNDFAYLYLQSQTNTFRRVNQGMGQPNLNTPIIAGWFFPMPPLAEQLRIVTKVDELMALCDRLEEQLANSQAGNRRLLDAVLAEAFKDNQRLDDRRKVSNGFRA